MPRTSGREPAGRRPGAPDRDGATYTGSIGSIGSMDTELLRRFLSGRGRIRGRRATRVTARRQRQLARAVGDAREMALPPYPAR